MLGGRKRTPQQIVTEFTKIMKETSKTYGVPVHQITEPMFRFVGNGRLGKDSLIALGGFANLRSYIAPGPKKNLDATSRKMLERLLGL